VVHTGLGKKQDPISKITKAKRARGVGQVVEHLSRQLQNQKGMEGGKERDLNQDPVSSLKMKHYLLTAQGCSWLEQSWNAALFRSKFYLVNVTIKEKKQTVIIGKGELKTWLTP
jgi:hypothetical protein